MKKDKNIIELTLESGDVIEFYNIADIIFENDYYMIVQPVVLLEGMDPDEALLFRVDGPEEMSTFTLVDDDRIIDGVFEIYNKLLDEGKKK